MMRPVLFFLSLTLMAGGVRAQSEDGSDQADFAAYSQFDFVAGKKVLFYDDFSAALTKWKVIEYDQSDDGEAPGVKNIANQNALWFKTPRRGLFYPLSINALPDEFTVEFDMWADLDRMSEMESGLILSFVANRVNKNEYNTAFDEHPQIQLDIHPSSEMLYCTATRQAGTDPRELDKKQIQNGWKAGQVQRVSISRNKTHIKLYVNEKKFIDLPNGLPTATAYTLVMATNLWGDGLYVTDFKLAQGFPPAPKMEGGKFVTNAIYFDVNSAHIKPQSRAALSQAAAAINSVQGKVVIVGHTDSDGAEEANLALSKRRAEAIKQLLTKEFTIDAARLLTDGKGEGAPIDTNTTAEGKANNRRVEFVQVK